MSTGDDADKGEAADGSGKREKKSAPAKAKAPKRPVVEPIPFTDAQVDAVAKVFQEKADVAGKAANRALIAAVLIGFLIVASFIATGLWNSLAPDAPCTSSDCKFASISHVIGILIIRLGAVIIGVFVMQVMIHVVRYNMRMYFHWAMCCALIKLSRGNHLIITDLAHTLNPSAIDFGKEPQLPTQKVIDRAFDTLKEVAKKIPDRH